MHYGEDPAIKVNVEVDAINQNVTDLVIQKIEAAMRLAFEDEASGREQAGGAE